MTRAAGMVVVDEATGWFTDMYEQMVAAYEEHTNAERARAFRKAVHGRWEPAPDDYTRRGAAPAVDTSEPSGSLRITWAGALRCGKTAAAARRLADAMRGVVTVDDVESGHLQITPAIDPANAGVLWGDERVPNVRWRRW